MRLTIERAEGPSSGLVDGLAALLMDAVASNAGISFMSDLTLESGFRSEQCRDLL